MKKNTLYKHIQAIDVVFQPTVIVDDGDCLSMNGIWYNISTGSLYPIAKDKIKLKKEEIQNWEVYEE